MAERQPPVTVVGVGHAALDHVFTVDALPSRPGKVAARRYRCLVGGMTANAAVAAARLGAAVHLVSPVGDDAAATLFAEHFAREGVDATGLLRVPGAGSSVSVVLVDADGERSIVNLRGDALLRAPPFDERGLAHADAVLTDPRCVHWAEAALRAARRRSLVSVLDADAAPREDLLRLVGLADWTVFSDPGRAAYVDGTARDALAAALAAGARVAVVTNGEHGLLWQRAGTAASHMPALAVSPIVDTTAAGDVFHGALAVALAEGLGDDAALRFASAAAALKCQQADGVLGAPRRADVLRLLAATPSIHPPAE